MTISRKSNGEEKIADVGAYEFSDLVGQVTVEVVSSLRVVGSTDCFARGCRLPGVQEKNDCTYFCKRLVDIGKVRKIRFGVEDVREFAYSPNLDYLYLLVS